MKTAKEVLRQTCPNVYQSIEMFLGNSALEQISEAMRRYGSGLAEEVLINQDDAGTDSGAFAEWCAGETAGFVWVHGSQVWKMKDNSYKTTRDLFAQWKGKVDDREQLIKELQKVQNHFNRNPQSREYNTCQWAIDYLKTPKYEKKG